MFALTTSAVNVHFVYYGIVDRVIVMYQGLQRGLTARLRNDKFGRRDMNRFEYWKRIILAQNTNLDRVIELMANDKNITNEQYCQLYSLVLEVY